MLKRIRQFRAIQARRISTAASPYDNYTKLRAFPFHIRPEEAQRLLSVWASLTCNVAKFWPSVGALALPFLNFDFLRPARFSAVYFPAWFVTGEVEASITYKGFQFKESAWFDNTYIPGSHAAVLSAAPLSNSSLMDKETVPFTPFLLQQHGEPVHCIPFSTSPFSILDVVASHHPTRSIMIDDHLSLDASSVKPNLVSAYPVLLPLYLAQYEIHGGEDSANNMLTFIIKAHEDNPGNDSIMCENLFRINKRIRKSIETFSECMGHESSGEVNSFFPEYPRVSIVDKFMQRKVMTKYVNEWLEELLCSSRNIEILAESSLGVIGKGDEDLRMREMTPEEGESLKEYTRVTEGLLAFKRYMNNAMIQERDGEPKDQSAKERIIAKKIKNLEAERAQIAPKWWSEWLALNRPESENTESGDGNAAADSDGTRPPPKESDNLKVD